MKRKAQPLLLVDGQQALDQCRQVLQQLEDLLPECQYLFSSEKTYRTLTERALVRNMPGSNLNPHDRHHRFGYRMAEVFLIYRLAQIMEPQFTDTTMLYVRGTRQDLQQDVGENRIDIENQQSWRQTEESLLRRSVYCWSWGGCSAK